MKQFGLNKRDKLCSSTVIDKLFNRGACCNVGSAMAYPLRAVWEVVPYEAKAEAETKGCAEKNGGAPTAGGGIMRFLISVPKRRVRHAVDRVKMRRRVREAYRLNHRNYESHLAKVSVNIAFVYIANELKDYATVQAAVCRLLKKCEESVK